MALWKDKIRETWQYSFQYQKERYQARGFKTKKEAAAAQAARKLDLKRNPKPKDTDYVEVAGTYLTFSKKSHTTNTYRAKKRALKLFDEFLGDDIAIKDITPKMISEFLATRPTNNSWNAYRKDLSAMFTYAEHTLEVIDRNPVSKVSTVPHSPEEKIVPSEQDVIKLLIAADPKTDERDLLLVIMHTLARVDEVLRMKWTDVNFENKRAIKKTRKTRGGTYKKIPTPLNQELYDILWRRWKERVQEKWVFYNEKTGTRFKHRPKLMRGLCKRAGIFPHFGFHTLRHLMASLLGDNPKIATKSIQSLLGHSNIRTTEIYLHSIEGAVADATDSLSGIFSLDQDEEKEEKNGRLFNMSEIYGDHNSIKAEKESADGWHKKHPGNPDKITLAKSRHLNKTGYSGLIVNTEKDPKSYEKK